MRAEIGVGFVDLAEGSINAAIMRLDKGAEQLGNHFGTWIAAGWAHFMSGDLGTAGERFKIALQYDSTFGEAQGSLAVIELLRGEGEAARQRIETAHRRSITIGKMPASLICDRIPSMKVA